MAALRHTCPVKISLTLPAGVVLPVKSLNFISNNDVWGRVVHSVVIIVAWVACITVLIKNPDQKTFLAWPVHLYTNCLQVFVSAGPPKCPWKSWKISVCKEQFWEKISIIIIPTLTTRRRSGTCTPIPAQSVLTNTWMLLQKVSVCFVKLSHILRPAQETSHHALLVLSVVVTAHFGNLCPAWHPVPWSQLFTFETQPTSCKN